MRAFQLTIVFLFLSFFGFGQPTNGLSAYYPFNGNANDESTFNNNGIVEGPQLTTDRFGNFNSAYEFDGEDDVIRISDNPNLYFDTDFTITSWIYPTEIKPQNILRKGTLPNGEPYGLAGNSNWTFRLNTDEGLYTTTSSIPYQINTWQFLVAMKEGNTIKIFIDGSIVSNEIIDGILVDDTEDLLIGTRLQLPGDTFKGKIDDIRFYDRALSISEIDELFLEGIDPDLVAYYPFDGNANDESPYGNNATVDGPQLTSDRFDIANSAYHMDGVDDIISAMDKPQLFLDQYFTLSAWVSTEVFKTQEIILKGPVLTGANAAPYGLALSGIGTSNFYVHIDGNLHSVIFNDYPLNEWFLITGVRDGNSMKLYINGDLKADETIIGNLVDDFAPLLIGTRVQTVGNTFQGKIDEVRIYKRALTQVEIQDLANDIPQNNNVVQGNVKYDFNANGCDPSDYTATGILLNISDTNGDTYTTSTNENGDYNFILDSTGEYTLEVDQSSLLNNFEATPNQVVYNFTELGNAETQNFCLAGITTINDIKITMLPLNDARPGFDSEYQLIYENIGTTAQSGTVTLTYEDAGRHSFLNAVPAEDNVDGTSITWNYSNLLPFESRTIQVNFNNEPPPTNNSGDILVFDATITPSDDNPEDNLYHFEQEIVNSQDPNDKLVTQGSEIHVSEVGNYLDYMVRFQNVGTASAIHVRVEDVFTDDLDWDSFRMLSASHEYRLEITNDNEAVFFFDNINLPSEVTDPEGSNGYIAFQMKTKDNLEVGDVITNEANIFFDFNAPILTNTVHTEVVENLGLDEFVNSSNVVLSPNPVTETLLINTYQTEFVRAEVYSVLGEMVQKSNEKQVVFSKLSSGIYFVKVETDRGSITKKVVKE